MNTLIIQYSPEHTASTLLVNALYGLIPSLKHKPISYNDFRLNPNAEVQVIKTHASNLDMFINKYSKLYKLFFICSEREELNLLVNSKYKSYENVLVFPFSELNETESNPLSNIINNIASKMSNKFGGLLNITLDVDSGIRRVTLMNELYETIKHKPFTYYDRFYHIHGSHRNRKEVTKTPVTPVVPIKAPENKKETVKMQYLYA
jgi:hypothetical protein